ncbi:MAG: threonine synthase [Candidatus Merdivicinus sp.]|jgi:threonine synthase
MYYNSTRDKSCRITAAQAIARGISAEGGLFVPEELPKFDVEKLNALLGKSYAEKAEKILAEFLTDFTSEELSRCVNRAYTTEKFDSENIAEISKVGENNYLLELWHGPTCAFKDMALQLLPHLMTVSAAKTEPGQEIVVLVATSGDTGKAALEGFKDVPGTRMLVFYPENGVSNMQKRQMTTQEGKNLAVCAIQGNFDDAQTGVKQIFTNPAIQERLAANHQKFSSANSINWGRLVPQIVYYIAAYTSLVDQGEIEMGEVVNVAVPTGNFGNILAAYYAKKMGLPIGMLICASNRNKVLTDFIQTGTYDRNRDFYTTTSPSMDILISSNLERLLYDLCGQDDLMIREWFGELSRNGKYTVSADVKAKLQAEFAGGFCDDEQTAETIGNTFREYGYLCDTHTAVAVKVCEDYRRKTGDTRKTIIASTASPYKFTADVLKAVTDRPIPEDDFEQVALLAEISGMTPPESLLALRDKQIRFTGSVSKENMVSSVLELLNQ